MVRLAAPSGSATAGNAGREERALAGRALELELAAECLHAVGKPAQSGSAGRVSAAGAVVGNAQDDMPVVGLEPNGRCGRVGVLRDVGESFGGDVVHDRLDG